MKSAGKSIFSILKYKDNAASNANFELLEDSDDKASKKGGKSPLDEDTAKVSASLEEIDEHLKRRYSFPENKSFYMRGFNLGRKVKARMAYIEGIVDKNIINQFILPQLMDHELFTGYDESGGGADLAGYIIGNIITVNNVINSSDYKTIHEYILNGYVAVFIEGCGEALLIESRKYEKRPLEKPLTEAVIQGAQEGFNEDLRTNISLIRKMIRNENLVTDFIPVGRINKLYCAVIYIKGIANKEVILEVKRRISKIDADFIADSCMLSQYIEDRPGMLLPQVMSTERADRTISMLMAGQVAVLTDGAPFASIVPVTFYHLFHTAEDSAIRWYYGLFIRLIRALGIFATLFLPGAYLALILHHHEMIPTPLLVSIIDSKQNVPFPSFVEWLLMELSFELIREGGIRIPGVMGQTLGIIGALILGQAAVVANLVSPILIIIVATTGLGSYAIPNYQLALSLRIMKFFITIFGAILGFLGFSLSICVTGILVCGMKSFGVPYFAPFAPKTMSNADLILRKPAKSANHREDFLNPNKRTARTRKNE